MPVRASPDQTGGKTGKVKRGDRGCLTTAPDTWSVKAGLPVNAGSPVFSSADQSEFPAH